jgi:predicted outer membrane repeat protein
MKKITFLIFCLTLFLVGNLYSQQTVWVKVGASGTADGSSEANAFTTIGAGLLQIDSAGDILRVVGTVPASGISLTTTSAGVSLNKTFAYTIEGDAGGSTLTGTAGATRMFTINSTSVGHNVTFKNIKFTGATGSTGAGGGVLLCNQPATVKFENCIFDGNTLASSVIAGGGALNFTGTAAGMIVTITDCTFKNNTSPNIGGAIFSTHANLTITKTTFYNNKTLGTVGTIWGGAALYVGTSTSSVNSLTNCTFYQNTATFPVSVNQDYGAIRTEAGNTTVTNCLFYDNKAAVGNPITSSSPSDWGCSVTGTQTFTYSIGQWISNNVDNRTNFISFVKSSVNPAEVAANLTSSNLTWEDASNKVKYTDPTPGAHTPISFGNDGNDAGAWNSPNTWIGTTSSDWTDATNWSIKGVPSATKDALIAAAANQPIIGSNVSIKSLTLNASTSLTVNTGFNLTVTGAVANSGTMTLENNANLIQGGTTNTNTGNVIVKRNSSNIQLYDYTLWSSPVAGQKLKAFSPDTLDARFYTYNSGTNLYNVVSAPATTDFAPATGYLIRTPNTWAAATPTTFNGVFTGVPNNGDISFTMTVGASGSRYNLVGNPYPSPISISSFVSDNNANITGTLYFWRKTNGTGTAYCTYAGTTYTSNGNAQAADPNGIIQTGQGFFVEASGSGTALLFKNSQRVSNTANQFFRSNIIENNRIWLNATNSSGAFSQMAVGYMTDATQNVDSLDGKYINDSPFALTSLISSEEFTIQGRALPFSTSDSVPLGFKTDAAGNYTIAIDHVDGLFNTGQAIYLKDNLLNTVTDLSAGSYSFASAAGTFNSRFELVYQRVLGVNNPDFTSNNVIAFNDNGDIKINSGSTVMEQVRVYDLQGRLLVEKKQINATDTKITTTASNQVLLLEITATTGTKVIKKIIQ